MKQVGGIRKGFGSDIWLDTKDGSQLLTKMGDEYVSSDGTSFKPDHNGGFYSDTGTVIKPNTSMFGGGAVVYQDDKSKSSYTYHVPNHSGLFSGLFSLIFSAIGKLLDCTGHQNGLKITFLRLLAVCLPGICMAMHWGTGITPILIFPAFILTGLMNKTGFKANFFGVLTGGIVATVLFMLLMKHVA